MYSPMPPFNTWVIKLGGALLAGDELGDWLRACADGNSRVRCVLVAGGGALADEVRTLQARWRFNDTLAHALALETMRINARVLNALAPRLVPCSALRAAQLPDAGSPRDYLWSPPADFAPSDLPMTWAVTSDSIALWLAEALGAEVLVLVKSLAPDALRDAMASGLANQQVVDNHFPTLLARSNVPVRVISKYQVADFVCGRERGRLPGIVVAQA